jgi:hypothetical protein
MREDVSFTEPATNNITAHVYEKVVAVVNSTPEGKTYISTTENSENFANRTDEYATFLTQDCLGD